MLKSDNDAGTFRNSDIPSFEMQTEDMDNPPYRALFILRRQKTLANCTLAKRPKTSELSAVSKTERF